MKLSWRCCVWNYISSCVSTIIHWWRVRTLEACLSLLLKKPLQLSRIQIMGHLINLHTKHPHLMTQSCMDQSYVYMHVKAGIKRCWNHDQGNISDNFSFHPAACFFIFQTAVYLMFKSRQTMCEENDGNYSEADLWVGAPRTTIEGVRLTNSARPVWTNF